MGGWTGSHGGWTGSHGWMDWQPWVDGLAAMVDALAAMGGWTGSHGGWTGSHGWMDWQPKHSKLVSDWYY